MKHALPLILACSLATAATASDDIQCPLRDEPLRVSSPLIDVLLNDNAKEVMAEHAPGVLEALPPFIAKTETPAFSSIMSIENLAASGGIDDAALAAIDAGLANVALTDTFKEARCARYDNDPVEIAETDAPFSVLIFQKVNGFYHEEAIPAAGAAFETMGEDNGWRVLSTDKGGAITPSNLAKLDVVVWNNISGDALTVPQRTALRDWIEAGGGFVALHGSGGDSAYWWDWYADDVIVAQFIGHPMDPQFQETTISMEVDGDVLSKGIPAEWPLVDEWYSFAGDPRADGADVLATIDESQYITMGRDGVDLAMGEDHPIAWTRCIGDGRAFYSAIGHRGEVYSDPNYAQLLENAVRWAGGEDSARCSRPNGQ